METTNGDGVSSQIYVIVEIVSLWIESFIGSLMAV